ncbi:MAG: hypothetical protein P4L64_11895 [Caulobacteraceae bacterium]|nr:hypothetical protein [Caulobacteraceae bacterium]
MALDLEEGSGLAKSLLDRAASEASNRSIIDLSRLRNRHDASTPGALTPAMTAWYTSKIGGARGRAVAELAGQFQAERMPEGSPQSTFLEVACDRVRSANLAEMIDQTIQFLDHNRALLERFNTARLEFNTLEARHGRKPTPPRLIVYILGLLALVTLEAFINFESFMKVPYITSPFLATGATLAVAFAIAMSAHFHGVIFKQWNYLFSPQDPGDRSHSSRKGDAIRRLIAGGVLLTVALLMVAGSRYYYLREYIIQARILGSAPPSMLGGITFMLFGNIVAYLGGLMLSYSLHDHDPNYAEKDKEYKSATKKLDRLKRRRDAIQRAARHGLDTALSAETKQSNNTRGPNYALLRMQAGQLIEKDQKVLAIILEYRTELTQAMIQAGDGDERRFLLPDGAYLELAPASLDRQLTPRQYAAEQITLGFGSGER